MKQGMMTRDSNKQWHHDEEVAACSYAAVNPNDVRMVRLARGDHLPPDSRAFLGVFGVVLNNLYRERLASSAVRGAIDGAIPALADLVTDAVNSAIIRGKRVPSEVGDICCVHCSSFVLVVCLLCAIE